MFSLTNRIKGIFKPGKASVPVLSEVEKESREVLTHKGMRGLNYAAQKQITKEQADDQLFEYRFKPGRMFPHSHSKIHGMTIQYENIGA